MSRSPHIVRAFQLFIKQLMPRQKDKVTLIGKDNRGNIYFEAERFNNPRPYIRYYINPQFGEKEQCIDYTNVPPPWGAWLRYRRELPPTDAEVAEQEEYFNFQQSLDQEKKEATELAKAEASPKDSSPAIGPESVTAKTGTYPKLPLER